MVNYLVPQVLLCSILVSCIQLALIVPLKKGYLVLFEESDLLASFVCAHLGHTMNLKVQSMSHGWLPHVPE